MSSLASASEAAVSLQGEEDGRPGTVVLSNPADWQGYAVGPGRGETRRRAPPQGSVAALASPDKKTAPGQLSHMSAL